MEASTKTVPDVGWSQQAGRSGHAAFPLLYCSPLLCAWKFRRVLPIFAPSARFF